MPNGNRPVLKIDLRTFTVNASNNNAALTVIITTMSLKEIYKKYFPYFVDVWQYIVIIIMFILAAIFFL